MGTPPMEYFEDLEGQYLFCYVLKTCLMESGIQGVYNKWEEAVAAFNRECDKYKEIWGRKKEITVRIVNADENHYVWFGRIELAELIVRDEGIMIELVTTDICFS